MIHLIEIAKHPAPEGELAELFLTYDQRRRCRSRVSLADGREAGLFLPRGSVLRDGDLLRSEEGIWARVRALPELVSVVASDDRHLLTRAAYHLGNRHVPLQIAPARLIYPHDHVLDGMCYELGLRVEVQTLPFEPELGGYAERQHSHGAKAEPSFHD